MTTDEKMRLAGRAYENGFSCSQAVISAFATEMNLDPQTACRIMEGFGCGMGGMQEPCGALAAASAIIGFYGCDGTVNDEQRQATFKRIQKAAELFRREYGGVTCAEVLHGESPQPFRCGMKVKDTILIIERVLKEMERHEEKAV